MLMDRLLRFVHKRREKVNMREKNGEKYEPEYPAKVTIKYENADRQ